MPDKKESQKTEPIASASLDNVVVESSKVEGDKVRMHLPRPVLLTVHHGHQVSFPAGLQDVPVQYASHPYLKAHGATVVEDVQEETAPEDDKKDNMPGDDKKEGKSENSGKKGK